MVMSCSCTIPLVLLGVTTTTSDTQGLGGPKGSATAGVYAPSGSGDQRQHVLARQCLALRGAFQVVPMG